MLKIQRILLVFGASMAAGVALAAEPAPQGIAPPTRVPDPAPIAAQGQPVATAVMPREVRRAIVADAARRFKVTPSSVVLARAEQLTWSDGSLGCPQPGQVYTQALIAGFRVVAKTSEGALTYHTDAHGHIVVCAPPAG